MDKKGKDYPDRTPTPEWTTRNNYWLIMSKPLWKRLFTEHWSTHPQTVQNESKNVATASIDFKKAYDLWLQLWIRVCLKMYMISNRVVNFIMKAKEIWKVELTTGGKTLAEMKIQGGIFHRDPLSQ